MGDPGHRDDAGFTLIGLMVLIAVINIGLGVAVASWTMASPAWDDWSIPDCTALLPCSAAVTAALVAFNPMFIYIQGSVHNDALTNLLAALLILWAII